jgi:N6-adenosine-specific RNA methylase IME4
MKTREIINLPVPNITADDAHLYLWTTNNFLPDALEVMRAWGFDYKTTITWVKDRFGLGQYYRGQTEHCLFGVKGNLPYKVVDGKRQQGVTFFQAPRQEHSKKPIEMRNFIKKVSDREGYAKIELFAREKTDGWDIWGNEVNSDINL